MEVDAHIVPQRGILIQEDRQSLQNKKHMGILGTNVLDHLPQFSEWLRKMRSTAESKKVVIDAQLRVSGTKSIMVPGRSSVDVQTTGAKVEEICLWNLWTIL